MSKLIVVVVSWNTRDLTRDCLYSLSREMDEIDGETWVVDNASSDGSQDMIARKFACARLIRNKENVGFARANNQALREAKGDYYLLLNSDTIIPQGSIKKMLAFMDENPSAAACGPMLIKTSGEIQRPLKALPSLAGEFCNCLLYHFFPFGNIIRSLKGENQNAFQFGKSPIRVEILSAACLMLRREVFDKVGLLGEEYFLFSEENDYFARIRQAGLKSYYLPDIEIIHLVGMSRKKQDEMISEVNYFTGRLIFFKKFNTKKTPFLKAIYYFFFSWSHLTINLWSLIKNRRLVQGNSMYAQLIKKIKIAFISKADRFLEILICLMIVTAD
jgi:GT2 family glycosyltransferase